MTKKVAITGHTKGIGKEIYDYFISKNFLVSGFSRSNNFDISEFDTRNKIVNLIKNYDIFVNNAYKNFDNSQELILEQVLKLWLNQNKILINISSRWTNDNHKYCQDKLNLDLLCDKYKNDKLYIINLKPGLTNTERVKNISGNKMNTTCIIKVLDFILSNENNFRVHSITFGKD